MKMKNENTNTSKEEDAPIKNRDGNNGEVETKTDNRTSAVLTLLIAIQDSGAVLFHDQYNDTYIAHYGEGSSVTKISSKVTKLWLVNFAYNNLRILPSTDTINRVLQSLSAKAYFEGSRHPLSVRSVHINNGLWYDLGEGAVRITKDGWDMPYDIPLIFKRFPHQKKQVRPLSGGSLKLLLEYINIKNESDQLLFLVYVVAAFIPDYPHPLLILHGTQGAGKTTPMKVMKELIDPSELGGLSAPKNIESFVQTISHHSFMFYDNLSTMQEWFSDALARAATGDSFSKRELYTDDDDVIYRFQKTIALNGINQVVYKSDLLDRSILLNLERISPENRKEAQVFWVDFENDRPLILGAIFDTLAKTLAIYPTVKLNKLPRMADFARWGYAIAEASGFSGEKFIEAYNANITIQHDEAIEANPVAQTIIEFMSDRNTWQGTPAELYNLLNIVAFKLQISQSRGWPKDAARLGRALTSIAPNLIAKGVELERSRSKDRLIIITKPTVITDDNDAPDNGQTNAGDSTSVSSVIDK
ncbi:MAG: hypothetical protein ACREGE_00490 [Candidatus Microsaccharimonas sp.]